jgi:hypothetical protein
MFFLSLFVLLLEFPPPTVLSHAVNFGEGNGVVVKIGLFQGPPMGQTEPSELHSYFLQAIIDGSERFRDVQRVASGFGLVGNLIAFLQEGGAKCLRSWDRCSSRPEKFSIDALSGGKRTTLVRQIATARVIERWGTRIECGTGKVMKRKANSPVNFSQLFHQVLQFSLRGVIFNCKCHELSSQRHEPLMDRHQLDREYGECVVHVSYNGFCVRTRDRRKE